MESSNPTLNERTFDAARVGADLLEHLLHVLEELPYPLHERARLVVVLPGIAEGFRGMPPAPVPPEHARSDPVALREGGEVGPCKPLPLDGRALGMVAESALAGVEFCKCARAGVSQVSWRALSDFGLVALALVAAALGASGAGEWGVAGLEGHALPSNTAQYFQQFFGWVWSGTQPQTSPSSR